MATTQKSKDEDRSADQGDIRQRKRYVSQSDVPAHSLSDALRIPKAIANEYGKAPTKPLLVAEAMGMTPTGGTFRMLCGASIAYGLTEGGYNAPVISLTQLGRRIVAPIEEGDDRAASIAALLRPRVIREFLTRYDNSRLPSEHIARNVLEEMNVPNESTGRTLDIIVRGADELGLLCEIKGQPYVNIDSAVVPDGPATEGASNGETEQLATPNVTPSPPEVQSDPDGTTESRTTVVQRVFITHGSNTEIVAQLKTLLQFGQFEPVVAVESASVSDPIPKKIMDEMRSCQAAIIHVNSEKELLDNQGDLHKHLNPNVLIEIGAAMALYPGKYILLVEDGVTLPSNLQGLYEVRYVGESLDHDATMRLLSALTKFR